MLSKKIKSIIKKSASLVLSVLLLSTNLSLVQADDLDDAISDITGTGSATGTVTIGYGGFSVESNIGYRIYVLDGNGNTVEDSVADILYQDYEAKTKMWSTQKGATTNDGKVNTTTAKDLGIPRVIKDQGNDGWTSNYEEVKEWLLSNDDEGNNNTIGLINNYLGAEVKDEFISRDSECFFCIEPIFECGIFTSGQTCRGLFYGTTRNWLQICNALNIGPGSFLGGPIYNVMTKCIYINDNYNNLDLKAPTDLSTDSLKELMSHGYGLGMIYHGVIDISIYYKTHTYDYDNYPDIPEKAPETPSEYNKGKTIIKCYEDYNTSKTSDKTLENYKWFGRSNTASIIKIEDEADGNGYTLTDWFTSSSNCDTSNSWEKATANANKKQQGNYEKTVELQDSEQYLYVRLVRDKDGSNRADNNVVISESSINANASVSTDSSKIYNKFILPDEAGTYNLGLKLTNNNGSLISKLSYTNWETVSKGEGSGSKKYYNFSALGSFYRKGDRLQLVDNNSDLEDVYSTVSSNDRKSSNYSYIANVGLENNTDYSMTTNGENLGSIDVPVSVLTYSGQSKPEADTTFDASEKYGTSSYVTATAGKLIKFRPYIKMQYKKRESDGTESKNTVNVQGAYEREVYIPSLVEVYYDNKPTLNVMSNMFAIDAKLTDGLDWKQKNKVLKYGSVYSLHGSNDLNVYTLQPIDIAQDEEAEINEAKEEHDWLADMAESSLDAFKVKEMYNKNWSESYYNGSDASEINETDEKYNLSSVEKETANSPVVEANKKPTKTTYWKLSSDTNGNIYLDNSSDLNSLKSKQSNLILHKTEGVDSLKDGSDAKNFEGRIDLVSRYLEAIERNTGNDKSADWASDNGHWYNEASAIYLRQDLTSINVGFEKVKRTLINGLKVPSDSRTDMGTKAYSFGWVLDVPDKKAITDFRGTKIKFSNPAMILFSKTVYATNMSVQDNM